MALHGDRFDPFISTYAKTSAFFSHAYAFTQRWLSKHGEWPKRLDRAHVGFSSLSQQVEDGACGYASEQGVDVIVCGHTHRAKRTVFASPAQAAAPSNISTRAAGSIARPAS